MGFKLNPDAVELFPASGHRRGKRADWRWTSVSKQQIRYAGGDERCGRRRVGLLNPLSGGHTSKACTWIDGPNKISVIEKRGLLGKVGEGHGQRGGVMQRQVKMRLEHGPAPGNSIYRPGIFVHCPLRDAVGPAMRRCFCRNVKCSAVTS